jgi:hypothetical protein
MNEEELDENEPIDPNDPEKGLDKFVKRNEERRQKEYEENKYKNRELRKKQQEGRQLDIPGMFEAGSGFRQTASIATEVLLESGMDLFSVAAPLQVPASAIINALAQKIRGGEFSRGEQLASMAATLLPGGAQGKALARFAKAGAKGAVSGGIQTTGRTLVDEGRRPTLEEFGIGVGTGAAFGGLFQTAASTKQVQELAERVRKEGSKLSDEFMAPFRVAFRGDLIGAVADGTGTSGGTGRLTQQQLFDINKSRKELLDPYTQKFKPQQWENFERFETGIEQVTGRPFKIEAPEPKNTGEDFTLVPDRQRGRPVRTMKKEDIDLNTFNFSNIKQAVERFRRRISGLMQIDRIRSADAGTVDGFTRTSRNINTVTAGSNEISSMYFDYLTGYFNRFIRSGKVDNFENAVSLIAPKVRGKDILPDQIQTVKGDPRLMRELRVYTIAPDVYKSGAFSPKDKTYQAKLKTLIRKYATADATDISYKFDAHHIDQIAEGWPLYRGLPKEEIPKMRALVQAYGLEPGNHPDNMLLLLNELHKEFHAVHWPAALERLKKSSTGWDMDELQKIKTAVGREQYVQNYVREVERSRDEVLDRAQRLLDSYADEKKIKQIEITEQEIKAIADDIKSLDPSDPLDRTPAPADIQKQLDED